MMVEVGDSGVQTQELLSAFPSPAPLRTSLFTCGTVGLFDDVVTSGPGDDVLVVDVAQARDLSNGGRVTPELVGMDNLWDIVFSQQPGREGLRRFGVEVPLKENIEHEAVFVHGSPKSVSNAIDARTYLVEMPPGTPSGFPVAQVFSEVKSELDAPLVQRLMTHMNAALVQQFLHVSVTQRKAVVGPDGLLGDGHLGNGGVRVWRRSR